MIPVPSAGPENVSAEVMSSTSVNVSWAGVPKFERNGMIQGYKVRNEGKGLTFWLLFAMFIVILLLSHSVSWDMCGT